METPSGQGTEPAKREKVAEVSPNETASLACGGQRHPAMLRVTSVWLGERVYSYC